MTTAEALKGLHCKLYRLKVLHCKVLPRMSNHSGWLKSCFRLEISCDRDVLLLSETAIAADTLYSSSTNQI